mmetsp:Transcript_7268/g.9695  ORF Transcript_7268/g.9695 Transcript_7268/m.9695 type:complete len:132 (+) Transcript_7268:170-565(+)
MQPPIPDAHTVSYIPLEGDRSQAINSQVSQQPSPIPSAELVAPGTVPVQGEALMGPPEGTAVVMATPLPYEDFHNTSRSGEVAEHEVAICRGCHRDFVRLPGQKRGSSDFYRCVDCRGLTFGMVINSCTVT